MEVRPNDVDPESGVFYTGSEDMEVAKFGICLNTEVGGIVSGLDRAPEERSTGRAHLHKYTRDYFTSQDWQVYSS